MSKASRSIVKSQNPIVVDDPGIKNIVEYIQKGKYEDAIAWVKNKKVEEEQVVSRQELFDAYPADGAHAFTAVLKETYGWIEQKPIQTFFGEQPPKILVMDTSHDTKVEVPWGTIAVPNIDGKMHLGAANEKGIWKFQLTASVRKKHMHLVKALCDKTREYLKIGSIYRGQPVRLEWTEDEATMFTPGSEGFDTPRFMAPSGLTKDDLVLPRVTFEEVHATIFSLIEKSEIARMMGVPTKRLVLAAGPYGCLAADTMISINRAGKGYETTIADVVTKFNGGKDRRGKKWDMDIPTMVQREMADGTVRLGRMSKAWVSGEKKTFTLVTDSGRSIRATDEHPFLTEDGWKRLGELRVGDNLHVRGPQAGDGSQRERGERRKYRSLSVGEHHPHGRGGKQSGYHVFEHRLIMEALLNDMPFEDYMSAIKAGNISGLAFLPPDIIVHHNDGNTLNNKPDNLSVATQSVHAAEHSPTTARNVLYKTDLETITSIEPYGTEITYDIEVEGEPHNFMANGFVVHNTGKTLTAAITAELCRKHFRTFLYLREVEHLADAIYFAQQYAPACVFAEDIDRVTDPDMIDKISNTIDGVDTKGLDVLFILTTNHVDRIPKKFLRSGRSDMIIKYSPPDAEATARLIMKYGGTTLDDDFTPEDALRIAGPLAETEMIPASIREVVERSKLFALAYDRDHITAVDLERASHGVIEQCAMLKEKRPDVLPDHLEAFGTLVRAKGSANGQ